MAQTASASMTKPTSVSATGVAQCTAVVGLQWGDEGKGKVVDLIAGGYDATVRYNGGANAGHSVVVKGERYALHLIPSGILNPGKLAVVGNGVVVDPEVIIKEMDGLSARGVDVSGLVISSRAHVVLPYHKAEDAMRESVLSAARAGAKGTASQAIGTTKRGIGPAYADKAHRATAVRMCDLLRPDVLRTKVELSCAIKNATVRGLAMAGEEHRSPRAAIGGTGDGQQFQPDDIMAWATPLAARLRERVTDTTYLLHDMLTSGKRLLFEGANAALLDVDHGTHPFVTSSSTTVLGIPAGTGIPGSRIGEVIGVVKAYSTRVGNGPLPTELGSPTDTTSAAGAIGHRIREKGREYGTTTGRARRVGWLDLVAVRYSAMLNGVTSLAVMLLDVLSGLDELRVCVAYEIDGKRTDRFPADAEELDRATPVYETLSGFAEDVTAARARGDLPVGARGYIEMIERVVGVPVGLISVGPDRAQTIR
ncbi:MAG TPA: adenylosuccinate synthase [Phycisphaerales bacterium]|nr:adenylosuccinate synthase [Phycisphaerales bacterium]